MTEQEKAAIEQDLFKIDQEGIAYWAENYSSDAPPELQSRAQAVVKAIRNVDAWFKEHGFEMS